MCGKSPNIHSHFLTYLFLHLIRRIERNIVFVFSITWKWWKWYSFFYCKTIQIKLPMRNVLNSNQVNIFWFWIQYNEKKSRIGCWGNIIYWNILLSCCFMCSVLWVVDGSCVVTKKNLTSKRNLCRWMRIVDLGLYNIHPVNTIE